MPSVDKRVVEMKFDNAAFERGVAQTMQSLDQLNKKMNFDNVKKSMNDLGDVASHFSLAGIADSVDHISSRFTAMGAVGFATIQNLTNSVLGFAKQKFSAVFNPVMEGGRNRALNIEQAKFAFKGLGMTTVQVTQAMDDALYAVKGTAFGLDAAAGAASQLSASGVKLGKDMKASLRGISGVAAMTGSDYAEIADVFTKVAGQGRLMGDDLNRLAARGLNVASTLGKSMGKTEAQVREMVTKGKISFAQFSAAMDAAYGKNATKASDTYEGSLSNLHAAMSRLGAVFQTPHLESQRKLFNAITPAVDKFKTAITPLINEFAIFDEQRNKFLRGIFNGLNFHTFGIIVRVVVETIKNLRDAILSYAKPIVAAFREIFPPVAGSQIFHIAKAIQNFTKHLILNKEGASNLKDVFKGIFSIFKIVGIVVGTVVKGLFGLFGVVGQGSGGFLALLAIVGRFITAIQEMLTKTKAIQGFFAVFKSPLSLLKPLIGFVVLLANALNSLFKGDYSGFKSGVHDAFSSLFSIVDDIKGKIKTFIDVLSNGLSIASKYLFSFGKNAQGQTSGFVRVLGTVATAVARFFTGFKNGALETFSKGVDIVVGVISALRDAIEKTITGVGSFGKNVGDIGGKLSGLSVIGTGIISAFKGVGSVFSGIRNAFSATFSFIDKSIHAVISKISDIFKHTSGDTAIQAFNTGVLVVLYLTVRRFMKNLSGVLKSFEGMMKNIGELFKALSDNLKPVQELKSDILLKIAISVGILVAALVILANMDPKKLQQGLIGLAALFAELGAALIVIKKYGLGEGNVGKTAAMMLLMAFSIDILATAVKKMAGISWPDMIRGLVGVGVLLAGLTLFTKFGELDKGGVRAGAGLILMAVAINLLVIAVRAIGNMKAGNIVKAALTIDFLLGSLAAAARGMEGTLKGAAAMFVMATALAVLTPVLVTLGALPYENLAKGLGTLFIGLLLLASAANAMDSALPGAAAMIAVASAVLILTPALVKFGEMPWENIAKSMVVLFGALTLLVIAANLMDTALPGAAALLIVAGALAILVPVLVVLGNLSWGKIFKGVGGLALILGVLIAAVYALAPVIAILILATTSIAVLGAAMLLAGLGFLAFSAGLASLAVTGAAGFAVLIAGIVSFLAILPLIARQFAFAFVTFIKVMGASIPVIIQVFTNMVMAMLRAIQTMVPEFIRTIGIIIMAMVTEITTLAPKIYAAGLDMIIGFLTAIRDRIGTITNLVIDIFTAFIQAVRARLPNIIQAGIDFLISFMNGLAEGIRSRNDEIGRAGVNIASALIDGLVKGLSKVGHLAREGLEALGQALIDAFKRFFGINSPSTVFAELGGYLIQGLVNGFKNGYHFVKDAVVGLGKKLPGWMQKVLGINSPSKVFHALGGFLSEGFANGISASTGLVSKATEGVGSDALNTMKDAISSIGDSLSENMDTAPTIRPVLDLSHVEANAGKIGSMLSVDPISSSATYAKAQDVSASYSSSQTSSALDASLARETLAALKSLKDAQATPVRPAVFNIDTVQDGDTLLRRARATNKMLTLSEGGDSTQIMGLV